MTSQDMDASGPMSALYFHSNCTLRLQRWRRSTSGDLSYASCSPHHTVSPVVILQLMSPQMEEEKNSLLCLTWHSLGAAFVDMVS